MLCDTCVFTFSQAQAQQYPLLFNFLRQALSVASQYSTKQPRLTSQLGLRIHLFLTARLGLQVGTMTAGIFVCLFYIGSGSGALVHCNASTLPTVLSSWAPSYTIFQNLLATLILNSLYFEVESKMTTYLDHHHNDKIDM